MPGDERRVIQFAIDGFFPFKNRLGLDFVLSRQPYQINVLRIASLARAIASGMRIVVNFYEVGHQS